jgi:hypothetical protein
MNLELPVAVPIYNEEIGIKEFAQQFKSNHA